MFSTIGKEDKPENTFHSLIPVSSVLKSSLGHLLVSQVWPFITNHLNITLLLSDLLPSGYVIPSLTEPLRTCQYSYILGGENPRLGGCGGRSQAPCVNSGLLLCNWKSQPAGVVFKFKIIFFLKSTTEIFSQCINQTDDLQTMVPGALGQETINRCSGEFPGSVVRTPHFHCWGHGFHSWSKN